MHAAFQIGAEHPHLITPWLTHSQYLVIVTVPDEDSIVRLASNALAEGIAVSTWHEPDRNGEATAVALEPGDVARRLCASLPLLGKELTLA